MLKGLVNTLSGINGDGKKIKGKVVLMNKNVLDFNDIGGSLLDNLHELVGQSVTLRLISSVHSVYAGALSLSVMYVYIYLKHFFSKNKVIVKNMKE